MPFSVILLFQQLHMYYDSHTCSAILSADSKLKSHIKLTLTNIFLARPVCQKKDILDSPKPCVDFHGQPRVPEHIRTLKCADLHPEQIQMSSSIPRSLLKRAHMAKRASVQHGIEKQK